MTLYVLTAVSLTIWVYLLVARGGFWLARERLDGAVPHIDVWPDVVAIVPARNEADVIGQSVGSLVQQDYPGRLDVIVVDDHSEDGTTSEARAAGRHGDRHITVVRADALPHGWAGKVWAMSEGLRAARRTNPEVRYIWLSDADITHDCDNLRRLVATAMNNDCDMVSQMVALTSDGPWARLLIPAFVYFFCKLYPFAWVNDAGRRTAAAAGGCILLRHDALDRIGGFSAIQGAFIDDCSLARAIKDRGREGGGRLYLALTGAARSLRPYHGLGGVWRTVARTAFIQLRRSIPLLIATLAGMVLTYLVPPFLLLSTPWHANGPIALLAGVTWMLMSLSFVPILRFYRQPLFLVILLPVAGFLYSAMTIDSAILHWRGRGGAWKGRTA